MFISFFIDTIHVVDNFFAEKLTSILLFKENKNLDSKL